MKTITSRAAPSFALALLMAIPLSGCLPLSASNAATSSADQPVATADATRLRTVTGQLVRKGPSQIGGWWGLVDASGKTWRLDLGKNPPVAKLEKHQYQSITVSGRVQGDEMGVTVLQVNDWRAN